MIRIERNSHDVQTWHRELFPPTAHDGDLFPPANPVQPPGLRVHLRTEIDGSAKTLAAPTVGAPAARRGVVRANGAIDVIHDDFATSTQRAAELIELASQILDREEWGSIADDLADTADALRSGVNFVIDAATQRRSAMHVVKPRLSYMNESS